MTATSKLTRILATREGAGIELAFVTEDGRITKVLASDEQVDRLVDELEDILDSPAEGEAGEPPAAA